MASSLPPSLHPVVSQATRLGRVGLVLEQLGLPTASPLALAAELGLGAGPLALGLERAGRQLVVDGAWSDAADAAWAAMARSEPGLGAARAALWPDHPEPDARAHLGLDGDRARVGATSVRRRPLADLAVMLRRLPLTERGAASALDVAEQLVALARADIAAVSLRWSGDGDTPVDLELLTQARPTPGPAMARLGLGLDQLGEDLGASPAQRQLLAGLLRDLGGPGGVGVGIALVGSVVRLRVALPLGRWEPALQVLTGLTLNRAEVAEISERFGAFAGAAGADAPTTLTLELGPHEPPPAWVWAMAADLTPTT